MAGDLFYFVCLLLLAWEQSCRVMLAFVYWCLFCEPANQQHYQQQQSFLACALRACFEGMRFGRFGSVSALSAASVNLVTCLQNKQQKYCVNV